MVNEVTCELKVAPTILGEWGKEGVEFFLGEADDVVSGFFAELFEVKLGGGVKCLEGGCGSERGWGADNVGVGVNGGRFKGVRVD